MIDAIRPRLPVAREPGITEWIAALDWRSIAICLDADGYAVIDSVRSGHPHTLRIVLHDAR